MKTQKTTNNIKVGARVKMTSENSNWIVGELGTITWVGSDRVAVAFDGREDDYTVLDGLYTVVESSE